MRKITLVRDRDKWEISFSVHGEDTIFVVTHNGQSVYTKNNAHKIFMYCIKSGDYRLSMFN